MSSPLLSPILAMFPVLSVASFPPLYMDFFLHSECDIDKQGWCHATGLCGQHSHGQLQPTRVPCSGRSFSECHCTGASSETWEQHDSCVRSLCCRSLSSRAMFWRLALHVFRLNNLLCLVTMSFCLLKQDCLLRKDFLLFLWLKLRCDDQKNVFSLISVQQKAIL